MNSVNTVFYKYHGTGNDFILIDDREETFPAQNVAFIRELCTRRFGIGADGLILLQNKEGFDFEMVYFNADGQVGSMCGNGGRCVVDFAKFIGAVSRDEVRFYAPDGAHSARIEKGGKVSLKMNDVSSVNLRNEDFILDTGSPHCIRFTGDELSDDKLMKGVQEVRFSDDFRKAGINVNLVAQRAGFLEMRTYERGVEDETFSCGTGVTAAAIAAGAKDNVTGEQRYKVKTRGGDLEVKFNRQNGQISDIWLMGPAVRVFKGELPHA